MGSRSVYYQPPESVKLEYPAIVYSKESYDNKYADDSSYLKAQRYSIIVIDKTPDNPVIEKIMGEMCMCSFDRHYKADNLNHDVLTLYF